MGRLRWERGVIVGVALVADMVGEPPLWLHPVVGYGKVIEGLKRGAPEESVRQLVYGGLMLVVAAPVALVPALVVQQMARKIQDESERDGWGWIGRGTAVLIEGVCLKPFFALKMLVEAGGRVRRALEQGDVRRAREELGHLVSRERTQLTEDLAAAAAIESLAENVSDSVIAPLFYYALAGLPGAACYRLFNTFDSMIGYHGRYEYLGKAAARLDDVLNLVPARLTALLIVGLAPLFGGNRERAWRMWWRDGGKTESPNAGQPMAAAAGALGVQLEKCGHYVLGVRDEEMTPAKIRQAERMVWWVGGSTLVVTAVVKMVWRGWKWSR